MAAETSGPAIIDVRAMPRGAVLALNNRHAVELSFLDASRLDRLIAASCYARGVGAAEAFLLAFDQDAAYDSPNFLWFRRRWARFVYVDRVVVAGRARGRGLARRLYADFLAWAAAAGHALVACEVNVDPPNPASDALHAALGFAAAGEAALADGKAVRYLTRSLP